MTGRSSGGGLGTLGALGVLCGVVLATTAACGPRTTFDRYDRLCVGEIKFEEESMPAAGTPTARAELARAYVHYIEYTRIFREVGAECIAADDATVVLDAVVQHYEPDAPRPFGFVGGRARGHAVIKYVFRDRAHAPLLEEQLKSLARSGIGWYRDVPDPAGVDGTAEGAAAQLIAWLRRNKTNPGKAAPPPPIEPPRK